LLLPTFYQYEKSVETIISIPAHKVPVYLIVFFYSGGVVPALAAIAKDPILLYYGMNIYYGKQN
jgi:hypothetical protein